MKYFCQNLIYVFKYPKQTHVDLLYLKIKAGNNVAKIDQALHHLKAEAGFAAMSADEKCSDPASYVITFDLQQQMYIHQLTHSEMYYAQQVTCCNLGNHDSVTKNRFMCIWTESYGGRGSQEISYCIFKYLTAIADLRGKEKLVCWSDNCGGQKKNQFMLAMYLVLIAKSNISEVVHKFPVRGHTFLSCDRDFAVIKKRKRVCQA